MIILSLRHTFLVWLYMSWFTWCVGHQWRCYSRDVCCVVTSCWRWNLFSSTEVHLHRKKHEQDTYVLVSVSSRFLILLLLDQQDEFQCWSPSLIPSLPNKLCARTAGSREIVSIDVAWMKFYWSDWSYLCFPSEKIRRDCLVSSMTFVEEKLMMDFNPPCFCGKD